MVKRNVKVGNIPTELQPYEQWVAWEYGSPDDKGKPKKLPINPNTGKRGKVNDPATWGTFKRAIKRWEDDQLAGIGFVFTADDPFCGIDLDKCRNPKTGHIKKWARKIINKFDSYTEVSPSGTGVKIFIKGKLPNRGKRSKDGKIEIYDTGRYFTITGRIINNNE